MHVYGRAVDESGMVSTARDQPSRPGFLISEGKQREPGGSACAAREGLLERDRQQRDETGGKTPVLSS